MSEDNTIRATLNALNEIRLEKGKYIESIVFSNAFYDQVSTKTEEIIPKLYLNFRTFDGIPFTVSELLENRWALVMSDGTLRFSNDGEDE